MSVALFEWLARELRLPSILRTLLTLVPSLILYLATDDTLYLKLGVITVALWVSVHRVSQSLWLMAGHAVILSIAILLLYLAVPHPWVFTPLAAAGAFASVFIARAGNHLRSLGDYTFIPALYLSCELYAIDSGGARSLQAVLAMVEHVPISIASATIVLLGWQVWATWPPRGSRQAAEIGRTIRQAHAHVTRTRQLLVGEAAPMPPPYDPWLTATMYALAVVIAAMVISITHYERGEWAIISAATVVTGDALSSRSKVVEQFLGVLVGVGIALMLYPLVPQMELIYTLGVLGGGLSSVAFSRYVSSFAFKCFFVVLAAEGLGFGLTTSVARVETVAIGGMVGLAVSLAVPPLTAWLKGTLRHEEPAIGRTSSSGVTGDKR